VVASSFLKMLLVNKFIPDLQLDLDKGEKRKGKGEERGKESGREEKGFQWKKAGHYIVRRPCCALALTSP